MAKWIAKAIIQKTISIFPNRESLNHFFQKNVTKGVLLSDEHFGNKLGHAVDHVANYKKYQGESVKDKLVLELGSGWYPVVPIVLFLNDAKRTDSLDIQSWMNHETIVTTLKKFDEWKENGKLAEYMPEINQGKWDKLMELLAEAKNMSYEELLESLNLKLYLKDARNTGFEEQTYDFICSNNTFEHIYPEVLKPILKEFKRLCKPDGFMCHFIDLSDHFAHFDHSINIYNFLKFSESRWRKIDNKIQPQNRLRWPAYLSMYKELEIPVSGEEIRKGDLDLLSKVPVNRRAFNYSNEELAISHGYIFSKMTSLK